MIDDRARVLLVCTANICRSPAASSVLQARVGPGVVLQSRGTRAIEGAPMCRRSAKWAGAQGGATATHRSRQLTVDDVRSATVVLTASRHQRAQVIELRPSAQVRTFTLAQAARLAYFCAERGGGPAGPLPDRLLWLVEEMDAARGTAPRPSQESWDDIPDPHNGARHPDVLADLLDAVDGIAEALVSGGPAARS